jgi:hypothetical protein
MTPQTPVQERQPVEPAATPAGQPSAPPYAPPYGPPQQWQPVYRAMPAPVPASMPSTTPTAGQRLALAIVSLALLIPLVAIVLSFASPVVMPIWLAVAAGLIGVLLLGLVVVGVNIIFNWDLLRPRH